jgi:hypothetical protein
MSKEDFEKVQRAKELLRVIKMQLYIVELERGSVISDRTGKDELSDARKKLAQLEELLLPPR